MGVKYFKNSICSLVIISIIVLPYLSVPQKASAQFGDTGGITGYVQSLSPVISQLFQCKGKTQNLFSGSTPTDEELFADIDKDFGLGGVSGQAGDQAMSISTYDSSANKKLDDLTKKTEEVKKNVKETNVNETCLKSIGKLVIKMLLQKITQSTVAWINSGFDGGPAFIQDAPSFWKDVAKNEILGFSAEINNPLMFPFGQAFIQSQVGAFNAHFTDNARYSLNELMDNSDTNLNGPFSASVFMEDFSHGGWDAWNYMTQVPANNPMGFNILASTELNARLEGTGENRASEIRASLQQAGGFLGQEKCANPQNLSRQEDAAGLAERASSPTGPYQHQICLKWEYVTPGQMVAEAATKIVHYPDNQYLEADDLNDAIGAILDALLAQWSTDLQDGFADFSSQGADGDLVINFDNYNPNGTGLPSSQTQNDYPAYQLNTEWFTSHPSFNIRTDLTQALIDEQRIYIEKLEEQNKELMSKNGSQNYGLIPTIYQLDYCIPGPHPGWEIDSRDALDEAQDEIKDASGMTDENVDQFTTAWSFLDPGGFFSSITGAIGDAANEEARQKYYSTAFQGITGIRTGASHFDQWTSRDKVVGVLDIIFGKYIQIINDIFRPERMPGVTIEATGEFKKIPSYRQMYENNAETIAAMKSMVIRLAEIKLAVDDLNAQYNSGALNEVEYESQLVDWKYSFARLTEDMISGNDIAQQDNVLKQIKDKSKYIYVSLIKGPQGCEKELQDRTPFKLPWETYELKRMPYPKENPILYDYNNLADNALIPNPFGDLWGSNFETKMPHLHSGNEPETWQDAGHANTKGPGFVSFLAFGGTSANDLYIQKTFGDPNSENICYTQVYPNGNGNTDIKRNSGWAPICGLDLYYLDPNLVITTYSEETTGNLLIGVGTDERGTQIGVYTPNNQAPAPGQWDNRKNNGNFEAAIKVW